MGDCSQDKLNNNIPIFKSFQRSPYHSIKQDSYFHSYQEVLAKYIQTECVFVEIGVMSGGSLFMWRDFLGPRARIIGIEVNEQARKWEEHGFEIHIGDQADPVFWRRFFEAVGPVDVVLDDGGHTNLQQVITLCESLPHVRDGGTVIIEDVGTSYMRRFGNPSPSTIVEFAKRSIDSINHRCFREPPKHSIAAHVASVRFFESMIAFDVDRRLCRRSRLIANGGKSDGAPDCRVIYQEEELSRRGSGIGRILPRRLLVAVHQRLSRLDNRWGRSARLIRDRMPK